MVKKLDLHGERFGRLLVMKPGMPHRTSGGNLQTMWECICDCGSMTTVSTAHLRSGTTRSCGCYAQDIRISENTTHSLRHTPAYRSWNAMLNRCRNKKAAVYPRYGGRGITVCEKWEKFENFLADMGERPSGTSIDRINNNGNYEPGNCRWATATEQSRNRRNVISKQEIK